ncbi:MAG: dioxygenase [bacterium]
MHEDEFGGLDRDLRSTGAAMRRRDFIRLAASAGMALGALPLLGCGNDDGVAADPCAETPQETAGPFPGDGSNGPNVLSQSGIVRSDIRSSFGGLAGTAAGIPLTVTLTLVWSENDCAPLAARAIYLWHCDREGRYSLYSPGATDQNYLRGVQETDANGQATFTSIFPACYAGRWPHIHFEVYPSLAAATTAANKLATSQLAIPKSGCDAVYATTGYEQSFTNLQQVSLATDGVFGDGSALQLATMSGNVATGFNAALRVVA